jgi:hypothetical protein
LQRKWKKRKKWKKKNLEKTQPKKDAVEAQANGSKKIGKGIRKIVATQIKKKKIKVRRKKIKVWVESEKGPRLARLKVHHTHKRA